VDLLGNVTIRIAATDMVPAMNAVIVSLPHWNKAMKKLTAAFEIETEETIFSSGEHRRVIVVFAPPSLLGFRLKGDPKANTYWLTSGACFDSAVKAGSRHAPRFDVAELLKKGKKKNEQFLPFQ
jgi:hypothetical protein